MLDRLNKIIDATNAKIVLCSAWRKYRGYCNYLKYKGNVKFIDVTPDLCCNIHSRFTRGDEIKSWLDKHDNVTSYVIIDDDPDFLEEQMQFLVLTEWMVGLQDCHVEKAIKILNGKDDK